MFKVRGTTGAWHPRGRAHDPHFGAATQEGVTVHVIGALEDCGKVASMRIGRSLP